MRKLPFSSVTIHKWIMRACTSKVIPLRTVRAGTWSACSEARQRVAERPDLRQLERRPDQGHGCADARPATTVRRGAPVGVPARERRVGALGMHPRSLRIAGGRDAGRSADGGVADQHGEGASSPESKDGGEPPRRVRSASQAPRAEARRLARQRPGPGRTETPGCALLHRRAARPLLPLRRTLSIRNECEIAGRQSDENEIEIPVPSFTAGLKGAAAANAPAPRRPCPELADRAGAGTWPAASGWDNANEYC